MEPTPAQNQQLYRVCHWITETLKQPIYIIRQDQRTGNLYIQFGPDEEYRYFEINLEGEVVR